MYQYLIQTSMALYHILIRSRRSTILQFLPVGQISCSLLKPPVQPLLQKYFASPRRANQGHNSARLTQEEGRLAIVTKRAVGCGGRGCAFDERR
jgi:hypothetical protein